MFHVMQTPALDVHPFALAMYLQDRPPEMAHLLGLAGRERSDVVNFNPATAIPPMRIADIFKPAVGAAPLAKPIAATPAAPSSSTPATRATAAELKTLADRVAALTAQKDTLTRELEAARAQSAKSGRTTFAAAAQVFMGEAENNPGKAMLLAARRFPELFAQYRQDGEPHIDLKAVPLG